jgi:hypothetical protein
LCVASSETLLAIDVDVIFSAAAIVFDRMFIEMFAVKALFTHPNPALLVGKCWPWSVDEHRWILWVTSVLFFTVQVAFLTVWISRYCVFELKPLDRNKVHPMIAHRIHPFSSSLAYASILASMPSMYISI